MDSLLNEYIMNSYVLLQDYEKKGRYFHSLMPQDNSPVVVHKKTNQLTYVIDGEGTAVLNGKPRKIKKGTAIFVEAGTTHQFVATRERLVLFHIHTPDEGRDNDRFIVQGDDYDRFE